MSLPIALGCIIAALVVGCILGGLYRKKVSEREIGSAEEKAKQIINDAYKSAESKRRETLLEAKEEIHKSRTEYEREVKERRAELQKQERRLQQKEETLDRKTDTLDKKTDALNQKIAAIDTKQNEINQLKKTQMELLEKISGYTVEEAKAFLINSLKDDVVHEQALMVKEIEAQYKDEADSRAREIIATAIQRCAADHASEVTVSVVPLPNDEMKGRIIGREGRNIRAIETLTGCDLIIDDTPEAITLSSFDPVRREVARIALEKLIQDGRIHPARIEEMVAKAQKEVNATIKAEGERAVFETNIHGLHPELIKLLGRMKYRTSYGQNVLNHSIEVSHIAGLLASELGVDVATAKRAGLLHDIGKAIDHEVEGSHVSIGVNIARKYKESEEVIHAIEAHHGDVEAHTVVACLVQAADAISRCAPRRPAREHRELCQASRKARGSHQELPRHRQLLCHSGRPRDPHHGQARGGLGGSDGAARARHRQEDRGRADLPRSDQGQSPARDQGCRLREITESRIPQRPPDIRRAFVHLVHFGNSGRKCRFATDA